MVTKKDYYDREPTYNAIHDIQEQRKIYREDHALLTDVMQIADHMGLQRPITPSDYNSALEELLHFYPTIHGRAIARAMAAQSGGGKKNKTAKNKGKGKGKGKSTKGKSTKSKRLKLKKTVRGKSKINRLDETFTRRDEIQDGTLFCKVFPIARSMGLVTNKGISDADYSTAVNKFARLYPNAYPRAVARHRARRRNSKNKRAKKKTTRKQAAKNKLAGTTYRPNCP